AAERTHGRAPAHAALRAHAYRFHMRRALAGFRFDSEERFSALVIPADAFAHGRDRCPVLAVLRRNREVDRKADGFRGREVAWQEHARSVSDQRFAFTVVEMIADGEAFRLFPRFVGVVTKFELNARDASLRI